MSEIITWDNVKQELVLRMQTSPGTTIFLSYHQVVRIFGNCGHKFHAWRHKNNLHSKEANQGFTLKYTPPET